MNDPLLAIAIFANIVALLVTLFQFWRHARLPETETRRRYQRIRLLWMIVFLWFLYRLLQMA